jgi:hypothetical protein
MGSTSYIDLPDEARKARVYLGAGHPLTRVAERRATTLEQALAVTIVLCLSLAALVFGASWATSIIISAIVVQFSLAFRAALLTLEARAHSLDLIIAGRSQVPLAPVARQRGRLLDRDHRYQLARSLAQMRSIAMHPPQAVAAPIFRIAVVAAVTDELAKAAELLLRPGADVRGVALVESLLSDGTSALYGDNVDALRAELRRVHFALMHDTTDAPSADDPGVIAETVISAL